MLGGPKIIPLAFGLIKPVALTGLAVPVMPVLNTPPEGVVLIWYGAALSHMFGIALMVGVGGLTMVTEKLLVIGQLTAVGVTVTV